MKIEVSEQVVANLKATIQAIGIDSPLDVLATGEWLAELRAALPETKMLPEFAPEELRSMAMDWPAQRKKPTPKGES